MAVNPAEDRLPCGVELDALVAQLADDVPPADPAHQVRCPYCQTTLAALRPSWEDLQTLAREPVPGVLFASAQPAVGQPADPTRVAVAIRLVIAFGPPAEDLAAAVRTSVRHRLLRLTGAEITTVDILIEDVAHPEP